MQKFYNENKDKVDRLLFIALVAVFFYLFFTQFFVYLSPFFFGALIALIMSPFIRFLTKKLRFKRWIASLAALLVFLAIIGSVGTWLVTILIRQITSFVESAPTHIEEIATRLDEANIWLRRMSENLPGDWYIPEVEEIVPIIVSFLLGDGARETGFRTIGNISDFFLNTVIALVSAYFFMSDGERIYNFTKNLLPRWVVKQMNQTKKALKQALGGYFRAQGILMVMVFFISVIGLLILRSPYALFLALLFAILDFLPVIGPSLIILPWAGISFIMGNMHQGIGLLIIWGIITISRQVLQPKILGSQMGAHPLASLMSIYIGFRIFGLAGLIIGPILLMIFIAIREAEGSGENASKTGSPTDRSNNDLQDD